MAKKDACKKLSIYIHIPFCIRKCLYCDFLSDHADQETMKQYVDALCREITQESVHYTDYTIISVFVGGGTPSILPGKWMEQILNTVRERYRIEKNCEISMEANPGTITPEKLECWHRAGINRLSIGLQSAIDEELKALGRIHDSAEFLQAYEDTVKSGFNNINIDVMSAIPGQNLASFQKTLKMVTGLIPPPVHISAYSLIIEENTPFYENTPELPDEDCERMMYKITNDILCRNGYLQYEISNYAKPGYECRHNQVYWRRGNYVGFGIGAASLIENVRFSNIRDIKDYVGYARFNKSRIEKASVLRLSVSEQMEEFMFLGLRMIQGVSEKEFYQTFGNTVEEIYPGIVRDLCQKGLLQREQKETGEYRISLTRYGIDVSNIVMAEFLLQ